MNLSDVTNILGITTPKNELQNPPANPKFDPEKEGERKTLLEWTGPSRPPHKGFDKKLLKTLIVVAGVVGLLLVIMQEFFLILVIGSIVFIAYILSATPPDEVKYKLTNHGVYYGPQFYYWSELKHFFLSQRGGYEILNIDVTNNLPARLFFTLEGVTRAEVSEICNKYLTYLEEEPENFMDKAYKSLADKFDFESK